MRWKSFDKTKAIEIWSLALAFEESSRITQNASYDKYIKTKNEDDAMPLTYAAFVNHAFSFELYLKCLCVISLGEYPWEHKLEEIFNTLPEDIQKQIVSDHDSSVVTRTITQAIPTRGDFVEALRIATNAFTEHRYIFESGEPKYEYSLSFPLISVKNTIINLRPEFQPH
jgi:hypothetical protein